MKFSSYFRMLSTLTHTHIVPVLLFIRELFEKNLTALVLYGACWSHTTGEWAVQSSQWGVLSVVYGNEIDLQLSLIRFNLQLHIQPVKFLSPPHFFLYLFIYLFICLSTSISASSTSRTLFPLSSHPPSTTPLTLHYH